MLDWLIEGDTWFARRRVVCGDRVTGERPGRLVRFGSR